MFSKEATDRLVGIHRGRGDHGDFRIGGQIVAAIAVAGSGVAGVTGRSAEHNAGGVQPGIDLTGQGAVLGVAVVGTQRQVHHIRTQGGGVLQGIEDGAFPCAAGGVREDPSWPESGRQGAHTGEDDLPLPVAGVTGHGAGYVGAVVAVQGLHVQVPVGIVAGKGHLPVLVQGIVLIGHMIAGCAGGGVELGGLQEQAHGLIGVPQGPAVLRVIRIVPEGVIGKGLMDPAHAGLQAADMPQLV